MQMWTAQLACRASSLESLVSVVGAIPRILQSANTFLDTENVLRPDSRIQKKDV